MLSVLEYELHFYEYIVFCLSSLPQAIAALVVSSSSGDKIPCFSYDGLSLNGWLLSGGIISLTYILTTTMCMVFLRKERTACVFSAYVGKQEAILNWIIWLFKISWAIYGMVKMYGACLGSVSASDFVSLTVFTIFATGDLFIGIVHPLLSYLDWHRCCSIRREPTCEEQVQSQPSELDEDNA
ncbi:MAG: hypothetical protein ACYCOU_02425 [Sulfobacillus sp.]